MFNKCDTCSLGQKKKFNGKKFLDLGINEKQIGNYIKELKKKIEFNSGLVFQNWIDINNFETIDLEINNFMLKIHKITT